MPDPNVGDVLEGARPWINTGILAAATAMLAKFGKPVVDYLLESRRLRMQEKKDDRQGFGELIEALNGQVIILTEQVKRLTEENSGLREEVRQLHGIIDGMRRGDLSGKLSLQRVAVDALTSGVSPDIANAAVRADEKNKGVE